MYQKLQVLLLQTLKQVIHFFQWPAYNKPLILPHQTATNDPFSSMTSIPQTHNLVSTQSPASPTSMSEDATSDPFSSIGSAQTELPSAQSKTQTQVDNPQSSTANAFANFESQTFSDTQQPTPAATVILPKPNAQQSAAPSKTVVVPAGDKSVLRARPKTQQRKSSNSSVVSISSDLFIAAASSTPNNSPLLVLAMKHFLLNLKNR